MSDRIIHKVFLPLGVSVEISADFDAPVALATKIRDRTSKPGPVLKRWGEILRLDARRQFSVGGDPAWKALALSTVQQKSASGLPALTKKGRVPWRLKQNGNFAATNILIRTGRLRDAWSLKNDKDHIETYDENTGEVTFGAKGKIAFWMQNGTKPYIIRPKSKKGTLRFMGGDGQFHFSKLIRHPGVAARPIRVTKEARDQMVQVAEDYLSGKEV